MNGWVMKDRVRSLGVEMSGNMQNMRTYEIYTDPRTSHDSMIQQTFLWMISRIAIYSAAIGRPHDKNHPNHRENSECRRTVKWTPGNRLEVDYHVLGEVQQRAAEN